MLKDREWILGHIPHQGAMCLLDQVLDWDSSCVRCLSRAHQSPANPLRSEGRLSSLCGIEFAAQAMAVHGALCAAESPAARQGGYLVRLRNVTLHRERLDDIEEDLVATVNRLGGDEVTVLYDFSLQAGSLELVTGRATIVINPAVL
jgi:predicted hotdog family 3-hydroxylacyl-ACP dehydratase